MSAELVSDNGDESSTGSTKDRPRACCTICGQTGDRLLHRITRFGVPLTFRKCRCGLIRQSPTPSVEWLARFFESGEFTRSPTERGLDIWGYHDYLSEAAARQWTARWRHGLLKSLLRDRERIVQIGPGGDPLLRLLADDGHEVVACEASEQMARICGSVTGVPVVCGRFEEQDFPPSSFDCILAFNVLENVPAPEQFLAAMSRTVRSGGLVVLNFVDTRMNLMAALQGQRYFMYRPPVCYMFTEANLRRLLGEQDLEVQAVRSDVRYMDLEKLAVLLRMRCLRSMAHATGLNKRLLRIPAYPSKLLVARKA